MPITMQRASDGALFTSSDLGCAAALLCLGYKFVGVDKSNPRRTLFIFDDSSGGAESIATNYLINSLSVSAQSYFESIKRLKGVLYGGRDAADGR